MAPTVARSPMDVASAAPVSSENPEMPPFDPAVHLAFELPTSRHSFTELGMSRPKNAPDMCYTEPFQLFSEEGVKMIRRDLLRKETATWISSMWNHPATVKRISEAFGLPLRVLGRRGEVGHANVQLGPEGVEGVYKLTEVPSGPLTEAAARPSQYDEILTDSWHRDSTQIVCVVMLSDTSTMVGGETAIRTGDGSIIKARGAKMGGAVLMQGCHTTHAALRATNAVERISMVTSFAFADPDLDDSGTSLRSMDPKHQDGALVQNHFLLHKLAKLRDRIDVAMEKIAAGEQAKELPKREDVEPWVAEQIEFLKHTSWELFERHPTYLYKDIPEETFRRYLPVPQTSS
ncbi:hypothetical protein PVAG01_08808 [Phlyctema vagabunda]|uniref:Uncharacterized protein n=1 Tax=Phlyctema vagabunda TaxID=108571 RepID=A0ABR4PAG3_9HELO